MNIRLSDNLAKIALAEYAVMLFAADICSYWAFSRIAGPNDLAWMVPAGRVFFIILWTLLLLLARLMKKEETVRE